MCLLWIHAGWALSLSCPAYAMWSPSTWSVYLRPTLLSFILFYAFFSTLRKSPWWITWTVSPNFSFPILSLFWQSNVQSPWVTGTQGFLLLIGHLLVLCPVLCHHSILCHVVPLATCSRYFHLLSRSWSSPEVTDRRSRKTSIWHEGLQLCQWPEGKFIRAFLIWSNSHSLV